VDLRLGFIMARIGRWAARKFGAQFDPNVKARGNVNFVVSVVSIAIYVSISSFMIWEAGKPFIFRKGVGLVPK